MIPKGAIEKAIEGGWTFTRHKLGGEVLLDYIYDAYYPQSLAEIALDPSFWQSLGKALGWNSRLYRQSVVARVGPIRKDGKRSTYPAVIRMMRHPTPNRWKNEARRFYDLILTGGDTEKFWKDLLG